MTDDPPALSPSKRRGPGAAAAPLTAGSLFSGIGGMDLGLERAGLTVVWQSETDSLACQVLAHHWPHVPNLGDITFIDWSNVERPDLLCGGFPCQDISSAHTNGDRLGLRGQKSGLWENFRRGIEALRPRFVLVENVSQWQAWVPEVRADLSDLGYASMPLALYAGTFGAPHQRPRVFLVADSHGDGESVCSIHEEAQRVPPIPRGGGYWRDTEPSHVRVDDGLSGGLDRRARLRALGNAVVPQVAEWLGRRIVADATNRLKSATSGRSPSSGEGNGG